MKYLACIFILLAPLLQAQVYPESLGWVPRGARVCCDFSGATYNDFSSFKNQGVLINATFVRGQLSCAGATSNGIAFYNPVGVSTNWWSMGVWVWFKGHKSQVPINKGPLPLSLSAADQIDFENSSPSNSTWYVNAQDGGNRNIVNFLSNWHHLFWTYDGTTIRPYVDGVALATSSSGSGKKDSSYQEIDFGSWPYAITSYGCNAYLAHGVYCEAILSAQEIKDIFLNQKGQLPVTP